MKKKFLLTILFLGFAIAFVGCSKEAFTPDSRPATPQAATNCPDRASFLAGKTMREVIDDLSQLSPAKKICLWEDKLNHSLQFFHDEAQRAFIIQSKGLLTESRFDEGNPVGFEESFVSEAKRYFSFEQVFQIFMVLQDFDDPIEPQRPNSGGNDLPECTCYWSISCGVLGFCQVQGCPHVAKCGVFGNSNCTGMCENGGM